MSVNYSARAGYGYYITSEEIEKTFGDNEKLLNEFYEDDFTFMIDSWGNSPNCFFGILYAQPAEGTGCQLEITHNFNHEKVKTMIKKFKELFPNHDALCHDYILSCVD